VIERIDRELRALGDELGVEDLPLPELRGQRLPSALGLPVFHAVAIVAEPPTSEPMIAASALMTAVSMVDSPCSPIRGVL
jgi:hypothetical protein